MYELDPALIKQLLLLAFSTGGIYAAIRADIKNIHGKFASVDKDIARIESSTTRSHERIDHHVTDYHRSNK